MNGKELFEGMGNIDDHFIEEAEKETISKTITFPWVKIGAMAACFGLIVCSYLFWQPHQIGQIPSDSETLDPVIESAPAIETEWKSDQADVVTAPDQQPVAEVPSVILRVDQMTENGFIGTVTELVDTDILDIGMELNVVYASDTRNEIVMESGSEYKSQIADQAADHTGTYVIVQFIDYNRETNTLTINLIQPKG